MKSIAFNKVKFIRIYIDDIINLKNWGNIFIVETVLKVHLRMFQNYKIN
jgi:hypothetical protein